MLFNRFVAALGCVLASSVPVWAATASVSEEPKDAKPRSFLHQLDDAFVGVFEKVAPSVVIVEAEKKPGADNREESFDFFFRTPQGDSEDKDGKSDKSDKPDKSNPHRFFRMPQQPTRSEGSGFIVRPDGYIFTNFHVIEDTDKIQVKLKDGRRFPAKVVGTDDKTDIAVLKIEANNLPVAQMGDSDAVRVGQLCFAIGIPYNLDYSFSGGFVSAKGRSNLTSLPTKPMYEDYIQTDAFINPGNSGGPLFDIEGRVIGMNTLINGIGRGLAFAIPSNMLRDVGDQLVATGKITRAWLGIRIETLSENPQLRQHISGIERGVVVDTIEPEAPAYKSDLRPADVIVQVDGISVATARDLQKEVLKKKVGQSIELAVWRNGKTLKVPVTTGELPASFTKVANSTLRKSVDPKADIFGLQLQDANVSKEPAEKSKSKPAQTTGAVVSQVTPGSPADEAGVEAGDLITEVDQKPVANATACRAMLRGHEQKGVLLFIDRKGQKTYAVIKTDKADKLEK